MLKASHGQVQGHPERLALWCEDAKARTLTLTLIGQMKYLHAPFGMPPMLCCVGSPIPRSSSVAMLSCRPAPPTGCEVAKALVQVTYGALGTRVAALSRGLKQQLAGCSRGRGGVRGTGGCVVDITRAIVHHYIGHKSWYPAPQPTKECMPLS